MRQQAPSTSSAYAGLGYGCLLYLVLYAGLALGAYLWLLPRTPSDFALAAALAAAVFLTLAAGVLWELLKRLLTGEDPRAAMLERNERGEVPASDGPVAAQGKVRATSGLLKAPLSGVDCVAYFYRMADETTSHDHGYRRRNIRPVYWGIACRPFTLDTKLRALRVMAMPQLDDPLLRLAAPEHITKAREYIAATSFEEQAGVHGALSSAFTMTHAHFSDDDGDYRKDWKSSGEARDPGSLRLDEVVIAEGDEISLSGMWSVERVAVVSSVSAPLKLTKDLTQLGRAGMLPVGNWGTLIWLIVTTALGAACLWLGIAGPALVASL